MTGAADWSGRVGRTWAEEWHRTERAFAGIAAVLDDAIAAAAPERGRAVDLGCGAGSTTLALAATRPGLSITGVDLAAPLVAIARERAGDATNAAFMVADVAAAVPRLAPVDLFVSRHGVMFFDDPVAGFAGLRRAAAPGTPLVFSCFRARAQNDWSRAVDEVLGIAPAPSGHAPGPYGLADAAFTTRMLAAAGWGDIRAVPHDVRYVVGAGDDPVDDALGFYRRIGSAAAILAAATLADRAAMEARLRAMLGERISDGAVAFTAAIWIWTASATGEAE